MDLVSEFHKLGMYWWIIYIYKYIELIFIKHLKFIYKIIHWKLNNLKIYLHITKNKKKNSIIKANKLN